MRILFVQPAVRYSIGDVGRGYRSALERAGHNISDYSMEGRITYHSKAVPENVSRDHTLIAKMASENILVEAMYHGADLVLIMSGLNVHPLALWLLGKVGIPAAVVLTESPYDDDEQKEWTDLTKVHGEVDLTVFTNDRYSAMKYGWKLLAPSFDPAIHRPVQSNPDFECDVLMVGTGWPERQAFLESINWAGIDLRIYGIWPNLKADSPLFQFYRPMVVDNARIADMYSSARICLNFHRKSDTALTPGPRAYELAACGAFQLSDWRQDLSNLFGASIPTFATPSELEAEIRYYLATPGERGVLANKSMERVQNETFDKRAADMMAVITPRLVAELEGVQK